MREGIITIHRDLLFDPGMKGALSAVFSQFIPTFMEVKNGIYSYWGFCDSFDEQPEGASIPQYDVIITEHHKETPEWTAKFVRL